MQSAGLIELESGVEAPAELRWVYRRDLAKAAAEPAPGEVYLCLPSSRSRRRQVSEWVLEHGSEGLPQGEPPILQRVLPHEPTLDDMLAAALLERRLAGQSPPKRIGEFARYAGLARDGFPIDKGKLVKSLMGVYLALANDPEEDLTANEAAERFTNAWRRLELHIFSAAEAGQSPFTDELFTDDGPFARELMFLESDEEVYNLDLGRAEWWRARVPGSRSLASMLILDEPKSLLFKFWARQDVRSPTGDGYLFLGVKKQEPGGWVFSTDRRKKVSLLPLHRLLQAAESQTEPARASQDSWFDGEPFDHTMIASPHAGSALADDEVLAIVKRWTAAPSSEWVEDETNRIASELATAEIVVRPGCPEEASLLPIAARESGPPGLREHVAGCRWCQKNVERLRKEMSAMRQAMFDLAPGGGELDEPSGEKLNQIGRYSIVEKLGEGGQAVVYLAKHPSLARELAIKLSKKRVADNARKDRFLQEGQRLAGLKHRYLATVYDLDLHDNRPFLVLEYIPGVNLDQYAKGRMVAPREAAQIVAKAARAVHAAHGHEVLHLDLKPANILFNRRERKPYVIDFGMAQVRDAWMGDPARSSFVAGTPAFMAPEQARGETDRLAPATDVFALGAVLYFLLTRQAPFAAKSSRASLARAAACDFDAAALENSKSNIPPPLVQICLRAMDPAPEERYPSAKDFAATLSQIARRRGS
jgi:tRNA A-37 threonylcarbamoyl transferase component Bud32